MYIYTIFGIVAVNAIIWKHFKKPKKIIDNVAIYYEKKTAMSVNIFLLFSE